MARSRYQNLRVFRLAEELADCTWEIVKGWSASARSTVGNQLVRAADSIGANIAEGVGRGSFLDNRRCVRIARGSLYETSYWLRRAFTRKLLPANQVEHLKSILDNLTPQLNAYLRSISRLASEKRDSPKDTTNY